MLTLIPCLVYIDSYNSHVSYAYLGGGRTEFTFPYPMLTLFIYNAAKMQRNAEVT